jgi:predicted O-linked N-acetylglucosamine transferase (SPINDLY family)
MNEIDRLFGLAIAACQQGALDVAERNFKTLLATEPNHIAALNLLGVVFAQLGKFDEAERVIERAIRIGPKSDTTFCNQGIVLKQLRRLPEALTAFDNALKLNPKVPDTWNNRGTVLSEMNRFEQALSDFERAIELKPDFADALYNRGNALRELKRLDDALASYDRALSLNPYYAVAYSNRGMTYLKLGRFEGALADYDRAIALKPGLAENYVGRGDVFLRLKRFNEAFSAFDEALTIDPGLAHAWHGRGAVLSELKRYDDALFAYDKALEVSPNFPEAWMSRSLACKAAERWREAIVAFERYLDLRTRPDCPGREHHITLASYLFRLDCIPAIYHSADEIREARDRIVQSLDTIHSEINAIRSAGGSVACQPIIDSLFASTGFYIAYQQQDDADLMRSYSLALQKILPPVSDTAGQPRRSRGRIRFGIASEYLKNHNGARWAYDWLCHLPTDDYEFFCYAFHFETDDVTSKFAKLGSLKRLSFGPESFAQSISAIQTDHLDILMLPDVGMTASSRILSQYRIAPIQFTAWGHPITTGSPNIDFFLSGDLMESNDAHHHYSEQLVRLPNLALYLEPEVYPADPNATFDFPADRIVFGALQSLFKYLPQYDSVYPQVAEQVPKALFVFVEAEPSITAPFAKRLTEAFARESLDAEDFVRFVPRMSPNRFAALCKGIYASIDSIGWSGGNTTIQCLEVDCPVVTLPGEFMRGRHSTAMLKMIGLDDLIATSLPDFVNKLVRLGQDQVFRSTVAERISRNKHKLYRDRSLIEALDAFLKAKVRSGEDSPRREGAPNHPQIC